MVLRDINGQRVRLDPQSRVRLFLADGTTTGDADSAAMPASEPDGSSPIRLFTRDAARRSAFAPLVHLELGYGLDVRTGGGFSVGGGLAVAQMFEVSGGVRLTNAVGPGRSLLGYVRVGGNFPFEAGDVFGAPIALDVAFGEIGLSQMRVVWGFRWRIDGRLEISILPVNPLMSVLDDGVYWDFPSTLQVGYRF